MGIDNSYTEFPNGVVADIVSDADNVIVDVSAHDILDSSGNVIFNDGDIQSTGGNVIVDVSAHDVLDSSGNVIVDGSAGSVLIPSSGAVTVTDADGITINSVIVPTVMAVTTNFNAPGECVNQIVFVADGAWEVFDVKVRYATAESSATNLRVQVERLQSTESPTNGDDLLTDNSNAGIDLKATANTTYTGTLVSDDTEDLADGNALGLVFEDTATELDNLNVTIYLRRI